MSESRRADVSSGASGARDRRAVSPEAAGSAPPSGKQPWWQLTLVYPTLAVTLLTALPTYIEKIEAWSKGLQQQELAASKERNRLITKNIDCMLAPIDWVSTANSTRVDGTICYKTGDILVRINWGSNNEFMDIVSNDRIRETFEQERSAGLFITAANAAEAQVAGPPFTMERQQEQVICQRWISDGHLLQRVQTPKGCFDQVVNTYRGVVESRKSAPCVNQC